MPRAVFLLSLERVGISPVQLRAEDLDDEVRLPNAPERLVINTGPLISLGRAGAFEILQDLPLHFVTPAEVAEELARVPESGGRSRFRPGSRSFRRLANLPRRWSNRSTKARRAVISLALDLEVPAVAIDEWRGRRAARALGLEVTGSLGLLGRAKRSRRHPPSEAVGRAALCRRARLETALVQQFLRAFGEE